MCSCPSRTDEPYEGEGYNQSPDHLAADLTTNQDLNGIANAREVRNRDARTITGSSKSPDEDIHNTPPEPPTNEAVVGEKSIDEGDFISRLDGAGGDDDRKTATGVVELVASGSSLRPNNGGGGGSEKSSRVARLKEVLRTYAKFVGPGFMIAVAYSP